MTLTQRILALQKISKELEPIKSQRDQLINKVHDFSNTFIDTLDDVNTFSSDRENSETLKITNTQKSIDEILSIYTNEVATKGINAASGGHLGYIPGGGIYTSSISDYLADVTNEYAGVYYGSPGAVAIENELIDWMKGVFGFPESAVGNLTSGGSIANLVALTAARDQHGIKNEKITKSVVYLSPQVHHCIQKALRIIGLEDVVINYLELDDNSKIITESLNDKIATDKKNGLTPFLVIASAGTTDTGAIDPLDTIADIAEKHNMWYHVDGAYGGFFILCDAKKHLFKGIEKADSLVIDPHKSLFLPYGLGAVLVKNKEAVFHSHVYRASYMQDAVKEEPIISPADLSPELTKHFRGLRLWIPLQFHGIAPFAACLEEKLLLTTYFRERLQAIGFKVGPEPDLSVSYFWYPATNVDAYNKSLLEAIHDDGEVFLSSTIINGRFVIRMAILSFRTKIHTIDKTIAMLERVMKAIK